MAAVLMPLGTLPGQEAPVLIKAVSCPAADSAVGPLTSAQRKSILRGSFAASTGRTYLNSDAALLSATGVMVHVGWPGRGAPTDVTAQLTISLPSSILGASPAADSLRAVVDDSVRFVLGRPVPPRVESPRLPRFLPFTLILEGGGFLRLARAGSAVFSFGGQRVKASHGELAAINAMWRAVTCGVALPGSS